MFGGIGVRILVILAILAVLACRVDAARLQLVADGQTDYSIVIPPEPSPAEKLAADELSKYLEQMSGAKIDVAAAPKLPKRAIIVATYDSLGEWGLPIPKTGKSWDDFTVEVRDQQLYILGARDRATLNGAYEFLRQLGCRWLAPKFDHYKGASEYVPSARTIGFEQTAPFVHSPKLGIRKLYVEEGRSHTAENLVQLVEWMS